MVIKLTLHNIFCFLKSHLLQLERWRLSWCAPFSRDIFDCCRLYGLCLHRLIPSLTHKKMRRPHQHTFLFRVACEGLKLLAVMLAGFISACLFLAPFGAFDQAETLLRSAMPFFFKLTVSLLSLIAIAGLFESLE